MFASVVVVVIAIFIVSGNLLLLSCPLLFDSWMYRLTRVAVSSADKLADGPGDTDADGESGDSTGWWQWQLQ